jgi:hypothetical protein
MKLLAPVLILAVLFAAPATPCRECAAVPGMQYKSPAHRELEDGSPVFAQIGSGHGQYQSGGKRQAGRPPEERAEMHRQGKYIAQLRLLKLLELLDMDKDQEAPFITAFHAMRKEGSDLDSRHVALTEQLADGLREQTISDQQTYDLIDRITTIELQKRELMVMFLSQAREILTARQLGRLVVFQDRFELELLERVQAFRRGSRRGMNPGSPGPPDEPFEDR